MADCFYCGREVDPDNRATYRGVKGWERRAMAASRQGGSDISCRRAVDEYACAPCISKLKSGIDPGQASLL